MPTFLQKVFQLCERHHFIIPLISNNSKCVMGFKYGPCGELLKGNITHEWNLNNDIIPDENVFPHQGENKFLQDFKEQYCYVKTLCSERVPFGISEIRHVKDAHPPEEKVSANFTSGVTEGELFCPKNHTVLNTYYCVQPSASTSQYDFWQRQRKKWWRKFSTNPGRFSLTDIQNQGGVQVVEIKAEFPWGMESLETIRNLGTTLFDEMKESDKQIFMAKDGRKAVLPHIIESKIILDKAVLAFVCDAYHERTVLNVPLQIMRFHRKLTPYKATFAASASNKNQAEILKELALMLARRLRKVGISTLLLPDAVKKSLESQFARNDEMGIPYTVVLNDNSLTTGIVGLRSRDTTLKEQLHISKLTEYVELLVKND